MQRAISPKLIIIVGPTASGKSELAVQIAKRITGAIISADSRQIYRGMDIGSGKVAGHLHNGEYTYKGIPHYGIDIASPRRQYSVTRFQKYAHQAIAKIFRQKLTPIICGGTAHWIDAVAFNQTFPEVKPNLNLRHQLEQQTTEQLFKQLQKLDSERASGIDSHNPRRLIRALEIVLSTGKPVPKQSHTSLYNAQWTGLAPNQETLQKNITKRLASRLKQGMLHEVETLHKQGISWKRLEGFGLEYRFCALFLQSKITQSELRAGIIASSMQYAKRQMTWWKRNKDIRWFMDTEPVERIIF